jgi:hypothetical protein
MLSISEARFVAVIARFFPGPDDVAPYHPRAFNFAPSVLPGEPSPVPWRQGSTVAERQGPAEPLAADLGRG